MRGRGGKKGGEKGGWMGGWGGWEVWGPETSGDDTVQVDIFTQRVLNEQMGCMR